MWLLTSAESVRTLLAGQVPAELIGTVEGARQVETLFVQIEYGVYV